VAEVPEAINLGKVAARVRALVKFDEGGDLSPLARRLGVNEATLRNTLASDRPRLDARTLAAVVQEFGIDPTWLLTGEYNIATHHMALDDDAFQSASAVTQFITARLSPMPSRALRRTDLPAGLDD
jgi:transcriptional regulator with XRE-family HTH domain